MGEDIFKSDPRIFKMDRKSPQASKLKSSVHSKLFEFLGSYCDDVLAEYIVVLVCNGKNQNQAREDLEAFLGGDSGVFVSWLWNSLSRNASSLKESVGLSCGNDVAVTSGCDNKKEKEQRNILLRDSQRCCAFSDATSMEETAEHDVTHDNGNVAVKHVSSQVRCSSGILAGVVEHHQSLQYEDKKIANSIHITSPHEQLQSAKREPVKRNLKSAATENLHSISISTTKAAGTRASVKAPEAVTPSHSIVPRPSVWDRLGKPCEENAVVIGEKISPCFIENNQRQKLGHKGQGIDKHKLMRVVPAGKKITGEISVIDNNCGKVVPSTYTDEYGRLDKCADMMGSVNDVEKAGRKRHFGEINPGNGVESLSDCGNKVLQDGAEFRELQLQSSLMKSNGPQSLIGVSGSVNVSLPAKLEPPIHPERGASHHRPIQAEVLDVKSRLRQIEMEMGRLRSKQAEMNSDVKPNNLSIAGAQSGLPEEDLDTRTVFVTNVHFAATKEALSLHFAKCGVVVKVVIGQPKGSAYIVFTSKEAVNKAVALDGTSFLSRILKIFRKGDEPARTSHPSPEKVVGKPLESFQKRKLCTQKSFQWRRDSSGTADAGNPDVLPVSAAGPESAGIVEQRAAKSSFQVSGRSFTYTRTEGGPSTQTPTQA